jgi:hypothetical protein
MGDSWQKVLFPTAISSAIAIALKLLFLNSKNGIRSIASAVILLISLRYLLWRIFFMLNFDSAINGSLSILFLVSASRYAEALKRLQTADLTAIGDAKEQIDCPLG